MNPPLAACRISGCRSCAGYDARVVLPPPASAADVPPVLVFATDAQLGYEHFREHFSWLTGGEVVEQLKLAWRSARLTIVRKNKASLVWIVEHAAFAAAFHGDRVMLVTKQCSLYKPLTKHCCRDCVAPRPDRMTLRSVQEHVTLGSRKVLYSDIQEEARVEYLTRQPDSWVGERVPIAAAPPIVNWPGDRRGKPDEFHYRVPIVADGRVAMARVVAGIEQAALIDADPAAFARDHVVIFTSRDDGGRLHAYFLSA